MESCVQYLSLFESAEQEKCKINGCVWMKVDGINLTKGKKENLTRVNKMELRNDKCPPTPHALWYTFDFELNA